MEGEGVEVGDVVEVVVEDKVASETVLKSISLFITANKLLNPLFKLGLISCENT